MTDSPEIESYRRKRADALNTLALIDAGRRFWIHPKDEPVRDVTDERRDDFLMIVEDLDQLITEASR